MNNEIRFNVKQLRILYLSFRYSPYFPIAVPCILISVFLLVLLLFFFPQVQSWFSIQDEIKATQDRISKTKSNLELLQSSSAQSIDEDFTTVTKALPAQKDFGIIVTGITNAASVARVTLDDFNFSVGEVSQNSPQSAPIQSGSALSRNVRQVIDANGMYPVRVSVTIGGKVEGVNVFIRILEDALPLAKVETVDFTEGKGQIVFSFFTKPFPKIIFDESLPLDTLNAQDRALLQKISERI